MEHHKLLVQGKVYDWMNTPNASTAVVEVIAAVTAALGSGYWYLVDYLINMVYDLGL